MKSAPFPIAAIVLDFDGVILESVDIKTEVFRRLFDGYPAQREQILSYHLTHNGISRIIKLRHIFEDILKMPYTAELEQRTTRQFSQLSFDQLLQCAFVPGAEAFLRRFSLVYPLYVASASPQEDLVRIIQERRLDSFFAGVSGHPVHKRTVIDAVAKRYGAQPEQLLYIGDSQEDFAVAREKGVRFVGRRNKEVLPEKECPVFDDLTGIADWLETAAMKHTLA